MKSQQSRKSRAEKGSNREEEGWRDDRFDCGLYVNG